MELLGVFDDFSTQALTIGLATLRIVVAFLLIPLFANDLIPALVRNAIFVSLAIMTVILQPPVDFESLSVLHWFSLVAKEIFIGMAIGIFFGIHLWAFDAAGQIIDTQIGY